MRGRSLPAPCSERSRGHYLFHAGTEGEYGKGEEALSFLRDRAIHRDPGASETDGGEQGGGESQQHDECGQECPKRHYLKEG